MTEPTVVVSKIAKHYGKVQAVRDVSFALNEGEMVALVGHNGAGKTTLIKLMLGLIRPSSGSIRVMGEDPASGAVAVRQRLGYLPESVAFHNALTGRETLAFYSRLKQVQGSDPIGLLERVGLGAEAAARPVRTYSKGMRQRLGLAQALLGEPRLLLLDEPTSGLDPASRRRFYDLLAELKSKGAAILLSSHALTELEDRADRLLIVNEGVAVADGTMDDLRGLARLPTHVRVTLANRRAFERLKSESFGWKETVPGTLEAMVSNEEKIELLRHVTVVPGDVAALHIIEPTLDDLYAHFLSAGKRAA
ncbi:MULTISPECIES: ABC transporter ATP-binding protein [unclassified Rhizobium]|uniref:ABC transporter ATP-binding protein n=1 Tax=unclassified Rhizobium TaxID=2613769 RepID=UPI001AD9B620|nr:MULTISPECIES: ABC transporter ATP-binding protein [unclassified Rhizobium]MBO9127029.1 ABC transporter ATP-binding protein [Rhizobium sp. 16-488-2b]MBO9177476.1 ABC transporter ATP-binding protein [Rhizobium sp. 16-488-2a]